MGRIYFANMRISYGILVGLLGWICCCSDDVESASAVDEPLPAEPFARTAPVIFTEVTPQNLDYEDEDGDHSDWVEIFNPADTAVNLAGYSFSNSAADPGKWKFGNVVVPPQSFLIVFFSKKDKPDFTAPSDSTQMIGYGAWGWSDAQSSPIAGTSSAEPWLFSKYVHSENGENSISGQMQLGPNGELGWSSACIFVGVGDGSPSDAYDLGEANQLLLTGYVTKGEPLEIRLTQPDLDDWKAWPAQITGTGDSSTTYVVNLPTGTNFPDLKNIYGTRFAAVDGNYNLIQFHFSSIVARNQGHFPHANFKLPKEGGNLFLFDAAGVLRDSIAYPSVPKGMSFSFAANGWGFSKPSPLGFGDLAYATQAKNVFEMPPSGFYSAPITVSFGDASAGTVRCEVGGKAPTENSPNLIGEMTISNTTVLRCATFLDGAFPGDVVTRTYLFEAQPTVAAAFITADPGQLFDPDSGIYEEGPNANAEEPHYGANYWKDKTIPAEITFFEPGTGTPAFEAKVGYEIFGNYSRANAKKSFALKFRKRFGESKLQYRMFPDFPRVTEFKDIVFRNNGGNFYQDYIRDYLSSSITEGLGVDYQKSRFAIVFYNGEYYGIHEIRERLNENYFVSNYGYDENAIDLLKADNSITSGSAGDYIALENYMESHDLSDSAAFAYVASQMDVDNYTSYVQTEMFVANQDWPGNNLKKWRSTSPQTKWKWALYDLDWGFDNGHSQYSNIDMFHFFGDSTASSYPNGVEFTVPYRNLMKNENFRNRFINRFSALTAAKFSADTVLSRIDALMGEIAAETFRDQERWKLNDSYMENQLEVIRDFAKKRPAEVIAEMRAFFGLGEIQQVVVAAKGCGTVSVDGISIRGSASIPLFAEIPVTLTAENGAGCVFQGWADGDVSPQKIVYPQNGSLYQAVFR